MKRTSWVSVSPVYGPPPGVPYVWRDPRRVPAERRAELAAHDARFGDAGKSTLAACRQAWFGAYREAGMTVKQATAATGVSVKTGQGYERQRKAARADA